VGTTTPTAIFVPVDIPPSELEGCATDVDVVELVDEVAVEVRVVCELEAEVVAAETDDVEVAVTKSELLYRRWIG
jgi:hypothetical protein